MSRPGADHLAAEETNWSFWKLFLYSLDGIIAFSTAPLAIASVVGILFCVVAFIWMIAIIVKTLMWGDPVVGYPTLACLLLLIGGSIQLSLGILGQYLAKTYLETKRRPIYIIAETDSGSRPTPRPDSPAHRKRGASCASFSFL